MQTKVNNLQRYFEVKEIAEDGVFEGYASVFDVIDSYKDIVVQGAFSKSLNKWQQQKHNPSLLWQHDSDKPIGIIESLSEDSRGLYMKAKLALNVQRGREAYELLKMSAISGLSIGYVPVVREYDENKNVRILKEVDLWEVSLVTFPANDVARITDVKSRPDTVRDFEEFLREAGFSRSEATTIALKGFKSLSGQREAATDELENTITKAINILKG